MRLFSTKEKSLIISEDIDFLDSSVNLFTWLEEEALRALNKNLFAQLVDAVFILRVSEVTELILS